MKWQQLCDILPWIAPRANLESRIQQVWVVIPGSTKREWERVIEKKKLQWGLTTVANCSQSLWGPSGGLWKPASELSHQGQRKLGDLCRNSHSSELMVTSGPMTAGHFQPVCPTAGLSFRGGQEGHSCPAEQPGCGRPPRVGQELEKATNSICYLYSCFIQLLSKVPEDNVNKVLPIRLGV